MGRQGRDQPLGETGVEDIGGPVLEGRCRLGRRFVKRHQVQVGPGRHLARAGLAQRHHRHRARKRAAQPHRLGQGRRRQGPHGRIGQGGVGSAGRFGSRPPGQGVDADAEHLLAVQSAHRVHGPLEILGLARLAQDLFGQAGVVGQVGQEARIQHPVQRRRLTPQGAGQARGEGHDAEHHLEQLGLVQEQGLDLNPGRQTGEEDGEAAKGVVGRAGPRHRLQQARRQAGEQFAPAFGAGRGDAAMVPGADGVGDRGRLGNPIRFRVSSVSGSFSTPVKTRLP